MVQARAPRITMTPQIVAILASLIACQTFIGVSGVCSVLMPNSLSASITPLTMQGGPPIAPHPAERGHHAVDVAGGAADRAGLAAALGAQRIGAARRGLIERDFDRRNVV